MEGRVVTARKNEGIPDFAISNDHYFLKQFTGMLKGGCKAPSPRAVIFLCVTPWHVQHKSSASFFHDRRK
jgi:hypothetical protein